MPPSCPRRRRCRPNAGAVAYGGSSRRGGGWALDDAQEQEHRFRVARQCERRLSGVRPSTMAERLAELARAPVELDAPGDVYGDGVVGQLEARVATLLGQPAAVFFPTGTMAQQVALRCWAERMANPIVAIH